MTCGIIGTGPLGIALADRLRKVGVKVGFLGRQGPIAVERVVDGEPLLLAVRDPKSFDLVLGAVPAYAVAQAFEDHASRLASGTPWLSLSNGMMWAQLGELAHRFPGVIPRAGIVQFGAREVGAEIVTTGTTDVRWGALDHSLPSVVERCLARLPGWAWDECVQERLVLKWIYNSVLNSLCATRGWSTNGKALAHWGLVTPLVSEAVALAIEIWNVPLDREEVLRGLDELVKKTAANENSMARAVRRGSRTEHDALLGWVHQAKGAYPGLRALALELEKNLF